MITEAQKQKILAAIAANRANYPSDAKQPISRKISYHTQLTRWLPINS